MHIARGVGLTQTRLAIIDLETGDQPIHEPGGAALIANAEIYNYVELRREMSATQFTTNSDCEPPLHLYRAHGADFAEKLRGMYAIAIFDAAEDRLVLARDPFGIKPLYYIETASEFAFASEPQALLKAGLASPVIAEGPRDELLQLQFSCGRETIFAGIRRVLPGETLIIRGGRIVDRRRRNAFPVVGGEDPSGAENQSLDETLAQIDRTLEESVMLHQRVPYGLFLSGGADSSSILALMARLNERPVRAFTVGFESETVPDERRHAREVARAVGAEHVEVEFGESDFWRLLPRIAASMDDPTADYAILPTWKLAREAAHELKVVLCGEGGDELFAGYGRYRSFLRPWWLGGRTIRAKGVMDGLGILRNAPSGWRDAVDAAYATSALPGRSPLQAAQAADCMDWLPNDLLTKLDRCLMTHGLEGRTPFLDPAVARLAFGLRDDLKIRKRLGKWVLRRWLDSVMPIARPFERKRGFTVPVIEWIRNRGDVLGPLVARHPAIEPICHSDRVEAIFRSGNRRGGFAAWVLLFYALWHQGIVDGGDVDGDIAECLAVEAMI